MKTRTEACLITTCGILLSTTLYFHHEMVKYKEKLDHIPPAIERTEMKGAKVRMSRLGDDYGWLLESFDKHGNPVKQELLQIRGTVHLVWSVTSK